MILTYEARHNDKLDNILRQDLKMSHRVIREAQGTVLVNGIHKLRKDVVKSGDKIQLELIENILDEDKFINKYKCVERVLDIIYEDEYILAINKPPNMPVHPSINNYENTLSNIVASYLEKQKLYGIHIVTRLDKDTSGVCIFAKHPYIQELFNAKKDEIQFSKEYICIVDGLLEKDHEIIEEPISRKEDSIILREVNSTGQYAKTEYFLVGTNPKLNYSVVQVFLHTGRTHQIRVHMSYIGHTLLGDDLYASKEKKQSIMKYITRQALHCERVSFIHPILNTKICMQAKVPEDLKRLM